MDILLAGKDQSQADQPNSMAEGPPVQSHLSSSNMKTPKLPGKHKQHIQGDVLNIIPTLISNSETDNSIYKVKYHAGIAGNGCADALAKFQANQAN
eukprot:1161387-Pelagomonas_calceolata.AAC.1